MIGRMITCKAVSTAASHSDLHLIRWQCPTRTQSLYILLKSCIAGKIRSTNRQYQKENGHITFLRKIEDGKGYDEYIQRNPKLWLSQPRYYGI